MRDRFFTVQKCYVSSYNSEKKKYQLPVMVYNVERRIVAVPDNCSTDEEHVRHSDVMERIRCNNFDELKELNSALSQYIAEEEKERRRV
jgi:hypothetical protein